MVARGCPEEARVLAARDGRADAALQAHISACDDCRELVEVAGLLRTLADDPADAAHPLPEPARLWFRAQLIRRWNAERRAMHQMDRLYPIQAGVLATSVIVCVLLSWPVVERWVSATEVGGAALLAASLLPAGMVTALVGGSILLALVSLLLARDLLTE